MNKKWFLTIQLIFILNVSLSWFPTKLVQASESNHTFEINHRLAMTQVMEKSYVYVSGEMINNLEVPITNVSFKITFYNYDQEVITTLNAESWLVDILPQRRTAFSTGYTEKQLVEGFANYVVEVENYDECSGKPLGLAITEAQVYVTQNSTEVDGVYMNNGSETTKFLHILAFFYGKDGFLEVTSFQEIQEDISPKDTGEFTTSLCQYVNETNFAKCILTAESLTKAGYTGYAIEREIIIEWNKGGSQYNYYWVFVIFVISCAVIIVMFALKGRKKRQKPHHTKTEG